MSDTEYRVQEPPQEPPPHDPLPPRFFSMQADYDTAEFDPVVGNSSGLTPYGPNVLVKMDKCATATRGGVMLLDAQIERMDEAAVTGCVFAIGPDAFRGLVDKPRLGGRVYIDKYAGIKCRGKDGALYRVVDEKCVACGIADDLAVAEM